MLRSVLMVLGIFCPFLIYAVLLFAEPRMIAILTGSVILARGIVCWRTRNPADVAPLLVPGSLLAAVVLLSGIFYEGRFFLFVPALINAALLMGFARSLLRPPSMIETFARLQGDHLYEGGADYCRRLTWLWCSFFAVNIAISVTLALYATVGQWTIYNGLVAQVMVGVLLGGERLYRSWKFGVHRKRDLDALSHGRFSGPTDGIQS